MTKLSLLPIVLAFIASAGTVGPADAAGNCDALRSQIEAKIAASGVANFTVTAVDAGAAASTPGKVVGSCEMGAKSIVYQQLDVPTSSGVAGSTGPVSGTPAGAARPKKDVILTECKDGSVSVGGDCKN
ncbi:MAG: hypothetical protein JWQ73_2947 [Variovorax sp.]|jgi:hypothetical protein|nr:hypothetical protein [Variovorax sp.]